MANGHGGARPNAGRKPGPISKIRAKSLADASEDAKYALGLFTRVMRDTDQPIELRIACSREVMDRVWGKPTQKQQITGADDAALTIVIEHVRSNQDQDT